MGLVSKLLSFYQERKDPVKFAKKSASPSVIIADLSARRSGDLSRF